MSSRLLTLTTLALASALASAQYSLVDLGTLGGPNSFALDVNASGQVSGNSSKTPGASNPLNAFLYSNGAMTNLGVTANTGSNNFSRAYALNDAGVAVGESDNSSSKAFVYRNGAIAQLAGLVSATSSAVAHDVNNAGLIVGISSNGTISRPVRWNLAGGAYGTPSDLGTIDGTAAGGGRAWGANESGVIVGLSRAVGTTSHATMWADGVVTDLDAAANRFGQAYAVNVARVAVGSASVGTLPSGTTITRAILWANGGATELGLLAGYTHSEAKDVNDAGLAVGNLQTIAGSPAVASLWNPDGSVLDLNSLLPGGSGWTLRSAEGINASGDIVGYGAFNGATRAFKLQAVPEPATLAALGLGLAALVRRRRSSR